MDIFTAIALFACLCAVESNTDNSKSNNTVTGIDQREVCKIKKSCVSCLRLTHCSWCKTENKCFSNELGPETCNNNTIEYTDYGFSLQENAECVCTSDKDIKPNCHPEEEDRDAIMPCSGRGKCVCGRCICETYTNSTKMVMGEYCEFDNFSCDGPRCNEGPYSLKQNDNPEE